MAISSWPRAMPTPRQLFIFFGLIATGKSVLAEAWARQRGTAYYNSDRVRKELAGLAPTADRKTGWSQGIYSKEFSRLTYDTLLERASHDLRQGRPVTLDASYQSRAERDRVRDFARQPGGVRLLFVHCTCPEPEVRRRLEERARDPLAVSDGRWEIYCQQRQSFEAPDELSEDELLTLETTAPVDRLVARLAAQVDSL